MTSVRTILASLEPVADGWRGHIPDSWLQGRTAYGGLSSAIALHAAQASEPDLPALRSAQVAFIGPLSDEITVRTERLRRGRNATFIQADVSSEAGLGLRATFVFMRAIESRIDFSQGKAPDFPPPVAATETFMGHSGVAFSQNFELVDQRDGLGKAEWLRWVRLRDREGLDPMIELMTIGDCLPPAVLKLLGGPAPVSSMTWIFNLLDPRPGTNDGWWLLRANSDFARDGGSSQQMGVWNSDGVAIAEHMQSVAMFA